MYIYIYGIYKECIRNIYKYLWIWGGRRRRCLCFLLFYIINIYGYSLYIPYIYIYTDYWLLTGESVRTTQLTNETQISETSSPSHIKPLWVQGGRLNNSRIRMAACRILLPRERASLPRTLMLRVSRNDRASLTPDSHRGGGWPGKSLVSVRPECIE